MSTTFWPEALRTPEMKVKLAAAGMEPKPGTAAEFGDVCSTRSDQMGANCQGHRCDAPVIDSNPCTHYVRA